MISFVYTFTSIAIAWNCYKQRCITTLTTVVELVALAKSTKKQKKKKEKKKKPLGSIAIYICSMNLINYQPLFIATTNLPSSLSKILITIATPSISI